MVARTLEAPPATEARTLGEHPGDRIAISAPFDASYYAHRVRSAILTTAGRFSQLSGLQYSFVSLLVCWSCLGYTLQSKKYLKLLEI